jgi:FixJ family two-component response regulator
MANADRIFVVDDDKSASRGITRLLRTAGYSARDFATVEEFLEALDSEIPGCVVMDAGAPGLSFEKLQAGLETCGVNLSIIVVTAHDDLKTRRRAKQLNAISLFRKPVDGSALLDAIEWTMRSGNSVSNHKR